jgi:hypothetical protein
MSTPWLGHGRLADNKPFTTSPAGGKYDREPVRVALIIAVASIMVHGLVSSSSALAADTLIQQGPKLTSGEAGRGYFGRSVALSSDGSTALIGGPQAGGEAGAAWVYTRSGSTWTRQMMLTGTGEEVGAGHFGNSVALSADGNTAVIGALTDDNGLGAAWVFTRSGSTWTPQAKLAGGGEAGAGRFGASVALSADGDTVVVGAPYDGRDLGAMWVFTRSGSTWTQQGEKLTGTEEEGEAELGRGVALSADGETALAGGPHDDGDVGAAWVFSRSGSTWTQQGAKLTGGGEVGEAVFGRVLALSEDGDTALVGGPHDNGKIGAAWVFTRSGSTWTQQGEKLVASSGEVGTGELGAGVALSANGETALTGGPHDAGYTGAAWVFSRSGSTWTQQGEKLTGSEGSGKSWFGSSVALSSAGDTALIGGVGDGGYVGAAWTFAFGEAGGPSQSPPPPPPPPPTGTNASTGGGTSTAGSTGSIGATGAGGVLAFGPTTGGAICTVALLGRKVSVQSGKWAALKLELRGTGRCRGRLKLIAKALATTTTKRSGKRSKASAIATATFSILAGKTLIVRLELNAPGRSLLAAHHGQLRVNLTILRSQARTETFHLTLQKSPQPKKRQAS